MPAPNISTALVVADFVDGDYQAPYGTPKAISDFLTGYEAPTANGLEILASNSNRPEEIGDLGAASYDDEITHYFEWTQLAVDPEMGPTLWLSIDNVGMTGAIAIQLVGGVGGGEYLVQSLGDALPVGPYSIGVHRLALSASVANGWIKASLDGGATTTISPGVLSALDFALLGHDGALFGAAPLEGYVRAHHVFPLITDEEDLEALSDTGPVEGGTNYTLTADPGSFALTGQAATLRATRLLTAASGQFSLTGQAANLNKGFRLTADAGAYALTGQPATFVWHHVLATASGAYTLTGQAAGLYKGRVLTAEAGQFDLTGQSADLLRGLKLTAEAGSFALTGQAAGLSYGRGIEAEPGNFALSGQPVTFTRTYVLTAEAGQYALTGADARLRWFGWSALQPTPETWVTQSPTDETWVIQTPTPGTWT